MQADVETQLKFADKYVKFNQKIMDAQSMLSEALNDPDTLTKDEYNYIVEVKQGSPPNYSRPQVTD